MGGSKKTYTALNNIFFAIINLPHRRLGLFLLLTGSTQPRAAALNHSEGCLRSQMQTSRRNLRVFIMLNYVSFIWQTRLAGAVHDEQVLNSRGA